MEIHQAQDSHGRPAFLALDSHERIVVLPTDYLRSLSLSPAKRADRTLVEYSLRLRELCRYLQAHPVYGALRLDDAIGALDLRSIDEFYQSLQARGLAASTVRGIEAVTRGFTKWLTSEEAGRVHSRWVYGRSSYRTPAPSSRVPRYLVPSQVVALLQGMHWETQRLIGHFIYDTGLRVSEVPRVLRIDLPLPEEYPSDQMYYPLFVRGSKGRGDQLKPRYTVLTRAALSRIRRYHNTKAYLQATAWRAEEKPAFLNTYGEPLTVDAIQAFIAVACSRSKLPAASAHRLRHGTAYSILRSEHGKSLLDNLLVVQRALGHSSIETTELYAHIPAPILARLSDRGGSDDIRFRFEEAQMILDNTFIPARKHSHVRRIGRK